MCQTETFVILKAVGLVCPEVTAMLFGTPRVSVGEARPYNTSH
jgi:hypothetical protein